MKETWYYLDSGENSPAYNMALDEALLNWHSQKLIPPTLRFYTWNPSTLSIGYFQKKDKINLDGVRRHGLGFVRRLTGGRAVFHDQELTYSVVVSEEHPAMPKTVTEAYRVISEGVLQGFRELGLDANFSIPDKQVKKAVQSAVCFDEPSWYELVVGGRKAAGSAQTRQKGVILQHGAIPLGVDEDKLFDLFVYPSREAREQAQEGFSSKAVAINLLRDEPVSVEEARDAFKIGFEKGLNIELESFKLSEEQEAEVREIAEQRYGSDDWTYLR